MEAGGNPFYLYSVKFKLIARAGALSDMLVFQWFTLFKKQKAA